MVGSPPHAGDRTRDDEEGALSPQADAGRNDGDQSSSPPLRARLLPAAWATVIAAVILGPALGSGVVLAYDLAWSPDARLTPVATGSGTAVPRAVPSDAVAWLVGLALTPAVAQKVVLVLLLVGASLGAVALARDLRPALGRGAMLLIVLAAVWNPFVSERLVIGQWTILLGYAVLPWAMRSTGRALRGTGSRAAVAVPMAAAGAGGVNSVLLVGCAVGAMAVVGLRRSPRIAVETLGLTAVVGGGVSAAWAVPSLLSSPPLTAGQVRAFAVTADTPLGVAVSLVSGGGFWNEASHPAARGAVSLALVASVLSMVCGAWFVREVVRPRLLPLAAPMVVGGLVLAVSVLPPLADAWVWIVTELPGGGALRDSHKFVAPWVVAIAVGAGLSVDSLARRWPGLAGPGLVAGLGLVALLSPQLAWGVGGRLDAVTVPPGLRSAASLTSGLPEGDVGLLPWNQYRRYGWNAGRVSLTITPRMISQRVLFDDSLPLRSGSIPGESPRAAAVSAAIASGTSPSVALEDAGVRYVALERDTGLRVDDTAVRAAGRVVVDTAQLLVVELPRAPQEATPTPAGLAFGWVVTTLTGGAVLAMGVARVIRRRLPVSLLRSRP